MTLRVGNITSVGAGTTWLGQRNPISIGYTHGHATVGTEAGYNPFHSIFQLSGVFFLPNNLSQSGVIRMHSDGNLQFATNTSVAGDDFENFLTEAVAAGLIDLNLAFLNGEEIDVFARRSANQLGSGVLTTPYGPVIRDVVPGTDPNQRDPLASALGQEKSGHMIALSGANPEGSDYTYSIMKLNSNGLSIRGSGLPSTHASGPTRPGSAFIGFSGFPYDGGGTQSEAFSIHTDSLLNIYSGSGVYFYTPGAAAFTSDGNMGFVSNANMVFGSAGTFLAGAFGNVDLQSGGALALLGTTGMTFTTFGATTLNSTLGAVTLNGLSMVNNSTTFMQNFVGTEYVMFCGSNMFNIVNNNARCFFSASGSNADVALGGDITLQAVKDTTLHAYCNVLDPTLNGNGSGVFSFKATDEHRTWNIKTGYDPAGTFNPLMHSGQICQLIDQKAGQPLTWWPQMEAGGKFGNNTSTVSNANGSIYDNTNPSGVTAGFNFTDSETDHVFVQFPVPDELDLTQPVSGLMYIRRGGNGSDNGDIFWKWQLRENITQEALTNTAEGTNIFHTHLLNVGNGDAGDMVAADIGIIFAANTLRRNGWIHGTLSRDGNHASDNVTFTAGLIGVKFVGTRRTDVN